MKTSTKKDIWSVQRMQILKKISESMSKVKLGQK